MRSIYAINKKSVIDYVDRQILICGRVLAFSDTSEIDRYAMESIKSTLKVLKIFLEGLPVVIKDESVREEEKDETD